MAFNAQREHAVMTAFRSCIADRQRIVMSDVAAEISEMPAERFWVSEQRAAIVVSALLAGRDLPPYTRSPKRRMFMEIFSRFVELRRKREGESIISIVSEIVHSPAPSFYMSPRSVMDIVYKSLRRIRKSKTR